MTTILLGVALGVVTSFAILLYVDKGQDEKF